MGYSPTSKAYRILDPQSGRVGVATSVVFDETVMPFVVAGRKMADSLDKFSFPTMLPNCSPPVVCADDPGDTPATVGDGAPSAVNCDSTPAPEVPAPEVSAVDDIAMLPTLEPPVIESDTVVAADTVSPASVLDGVHTTAPGEFRRSARIRDLTHATTNTLVPTAPSLPVVSPSTPPVVASPGQSWAVQSIVGYQLRRERDEYGTPAAHLTDHYKVRWVGDWDDTWESAACLSGAQETVDAYNASHMRGMRTARARAEAIERGDVVTDPVSCTSVDEQKHDGVHLQVKSLVAACTSSAVLPDDTLDLDDVISQLPPFACSAVALSAISRRLDRGVDSHTLSRIRRRLDIIALAMTAAPAPLVGCPPNVGVALAHAGWRKSVELEMSSFKRFGVWTLVPPPPRCNAVSCKWVFKEKFDSSGAVCRLKSRLTARGFTQRRGDDFSETWAPTCRQRTLRLLLAEASNISHVTTAQWDCTSAFLHADIDKEVYMQQPPGFVDKDRPDWVCRLNKSIYGLRQSGMLFFRKVRSTMLRLGATQSVVDPCLFVIRRGEKFVKLLWHVDDACVVSTSPELYNEVFTAMQSEYEIRQDPLEHFLGVVIRHRRDGAFELSQAPYLDTLVEKLGIPLRPATSPAAAGSKAKLSKLMEPATEEERSRMEGVPYRAAVGALLWMARATRPEISQAVGQVAKYMANPGPMHWEAVKRIFGYLLRVRNTPFLIKTDGTLRLEAFSDSDWAGCKDTAQSTTGLMIFVGGTLVAWRSKAQRNWAQSATEAEFVASLAASNECCWWRNILSEMWHESFEPNSPTIIWVDNDGAIMQSQHSCAFDASKHYMLAYYALRQRTEESVTVLRSIMTDFNYADLLTKALQPGHFRSLASEALGVDLR